MKILVVVCMSTLFLLCLSIMWVSELAIIGMFTGAGGSLTFLIAFPLSAGACYHSLYCVRETRRGALTAGLDASSKVIERAVMAGFLFLMALLSVASTPMY